jgi:hypothetical protein
MLKAWNFNDSKPFNFARLSRKSPLFCLKYRYDANSMQTVNIARRNRLRSRAKSIADFPIKALRFLPPVCAQIGVVGPAAHKMSFTEPIFF